MIRAQLLLREGQAEIRHGRHGDARRGDPRRMAVAWALVESTPGTFADEVAHGIDLDARGGVPHLRFDAGPSPLDDEWPDEAAAPYDGVTDVVTRIRIRADGFRGMTSFGRLFLRRTAFPATPGFEAHVACGVIVNPGDVRDGVLHRFEGERSLPCVGREDASHVLEPGMAAEGPFEQAIWGFGDVRRAFASTMHPDVVRTCARHAELDNLLSRTAGEEAEFADLGCHPWVTSVRGVGRCDVDYQAWKAHLRETGRWREMSPNFDEFPTAGDLERKRAAMSEAFREWHAERDGAGFRPG